MLLGCVNRYGRQGVLMECIDRMYSSNTNRVSLQGVLTGYVDRVCCSKQPARVCC